MSLLAQRRFELGPVPQGTLRADPDRLAQALRNLIGNAIEHTAAERGSGAHAACEEVPGGRIRFVVEDDGPGIPATQRERVFDRFHRTDAARDRASGGTGLGLAIVSAIAEAHGGRVSPPGAHREGGARIEIELPRIHERRRARGTRRIRRVGRSRSRCAGESRGADRRAPGAAAPACTAASQARVRRAPRRRDADRGRARLRREARARRGRREHAQRRHAEPCGAMARLVARSAPVRFAAHRLAAALPSSLQDAAAVALPDGTLALLGGLDGNDTSTAGVLVLAGERVSVRARLPTAPARRPGRAVRQRRVRIRRWAGQLL